MFKRFKKKQSPARADHTKESAKEKELIEMQAELLAGAINADRHNLLKEMRIRVEDGTVYINELNMEIVCQVLNIYEHDRGINYCIGFTIRINGEQVFYEEMAAVGTTPYQAILQGVTGYKDGFLDGLFDSLSGYYEPDFELSAQPGDKFHVTYSVLQVQGAFREDDTLDHAGFTKILFPLIDDLFAQWTAREDYQFKDYYWIKVYLSRQRGDHLIGECKLNYQDWSNGLDVLIEQDYEKWKKTDSFLGKKQFIFIKRCAHTNGCAH